jgi:hypothetical protein
MRRSLIILTSLSYLRHETNLHFHVKESEEPRLDDN